MLINITEYGQWWGESKRNFINPDYSNRFSSTSGGRCLGTEYFSSYRIHLSGNSVSESGRFILIQLHCLWDHTSLSKVACQVNVFSHLYLNWFSTWHLQYKRGRLKQIKENQITLEWHRKAIKWMAQRVWPFSKICKSTLLICIDIFLKWNILVWTLFPW